MRFTPKRILTQVVCVSTLVSIFGSFSGVSVTAVGWALPLVGALVLLLVLPETRYFRLWPFLAWSFLVLLSALITTRENSFVRWAILVTPFLVGSFIAGSGFRFDDNVWLIKTIRNFAIFFLAVVFIKYILRDESGKLFFAAESNLAAFLGWFFVYHYLYYRKTSSLFMWGLMALLPILTSARMATLALLLGLVLVLLRISFKGKILVTLALGVAIVGILYSGIVGKTFPDESASYSLENVRTSGRVAAWPLLLDGFEQAPWLGNGWNASQGDLQKIYESFAHPHNEWLRLLYDLGIVGTLGFILCMVYLLIILRRISLDATILENRFLASFALMSFVPYFMLMLTSNPLMHAAFFVNLQFAVAGFCISSRRVGTTLYVDGTGNALAPKR